MLVAFLDEKFLVWEPPPRAHVLSQNMDILDREKKFCLGFHWNFSIDIYKAPEIESTQYCPIMQSFL